MKILRLGDCPRGEREPPRPRGPPLRGGRGRAILQVIRRPSRRESCMASTASSASRLLSKVMKAKPRGSPRLSVGTKTSVMFPYFSNLSRRSSLWVRKSRFPTYSLRPYVSSPYSSALLFSWEGDRDLSRSPPLSRPLPLLERERDRERERLRLPPREGDRESSLLLRSSLPSRRSLSLSSSPRSSLSSWRSSSFFSSSRSSLGSSSFFTSSFLLSSSDI
mmetsp:Transcript_32458/g.45244  ORF Transcript_32458/g.45244 Transcript_32458/m.45244 type:complete len:220 (+) Transcript_32458:444-1103(+)